MPISAPRSTASPSSESGPSSCPEILIRPPVARSSPAIIMSSEVFPDPEGPTTAADCPRGIASETPRKMCTGPARLVKVRCTFSSLMIGSLKLKCLTVSCRAGLVPFTLSLYVS